MSGPVVRSRKWRFWLAAVLLVIIALGLTIASWLWVPASGDLAQTGVVDGHNRQWLVHLPADYRAGHRVPLVLAFHGRYSSPEKMAHLTGLDRLADRSGFIVVYPAGVDHSWAAGVDSPADKAGVDDAAFTAALLDRLQQQYSIDPAHIVLTGFSNGAHLVQLLGCRMADRVSAIVPVSGTLAPSVAAGCHPVRALSVVEFHGSSDPIDPFEGGRIHVSGGGQVLPVSVTMHDWAGWNHCSAARRDTVVAGLSDGISVSRHDYPGCADGSQVALYEVTGAGHTWPGGPQYLPAFLVGRTTHAVNASDVIAALAVGRP
ncbi:PHB depolymerase family esterase [Rhodanobacter sp. AS-Z3]|uniref:alpha/beta hydrolase family esterase n=1 Tax=Rhodanobacter sp. AS-Z3 TaxID=3031330 RepID=UPI0024783982|nr:PHB depolymerase family esterase [Rhodanobacter sp. AS-Z3]WEN15225.1 PHB depolymerase family esterase [Rhodanobacter sp. AS-Z3]